MKVALTTLGCKLNYAETSTYERGFVAHGLEVVPWNAVADIYVINTCAVTETAEKKSRNLMRRAHKLAPDALIVVTGCYAELKKDKLYDIEGVSRVFGSADKTRLVEETLAMVRGEKDSFAPLGMTEGCHPEEVEDRGRDLNLIYPGEAVEHPVVCLPVFPGSNCDYDTAKAFRKAGAEVRPFVFRNLTPEDVLGSIDALAKRIDESHILAFCGGFSSGDEPDGSGKFIADVIGNVKISAAIEGLLGRGGLILGICNGFQALVKSGLLPYGKPGCVTPDSPTLFRNDINRHISLMATTEVASVNSPWLSSFKKGERHSIAFSHGEGKFVVNPDLARELFERGQVAFRYVDNPNGSYYDIEGILSPDGHILGKMGHSERYEDNLMKNIAGNRCQPLFENAVNYFKKIR